MTPASVDPELAALQREAARLRTEREALAAEREKSEKVAPDAAASDNSEEAARLRTRLAELIVKLEAKKAKEKTRSVEPIAATIPTVAPPKEEARLLPTAVPVPPKEEAPLIPTAVVVPPGEALKRAKDEFRAGQFDTALASCRAIDAATLNNDDRLLVQYLSAGCLRSLGKLDEAAVVYRAVIEAHGDEDLVESATWQLTSIEARRSMLREMAEMRENRAR